MIAKKFTPCLRISVVFLFAAQLMSCEDPGEQKMNNDSARLADSVHIADSIYIAEKKQDSLTAPAPFKPSPEDSAQVADSVARNTNAVRDFN